ncbi:hypothetical protein C0992_008368, partial [Termitomyces sp. T32_za158]
GQGCPHRFRRQHGPSHHQNVLSLPTDETLDKALAIYHDLAATAPPHSDTKATFHERARGSDFTIYTTLLKGIADSANLDKYLPIANQLLSEMEKYNIAVNDKNASTIIVLSMRRASTLQEALEAYHEHQPRSTNKEATLPNIIRKDLTA